jgi:hypothetical protein
MTTYYVDGAVGDDTNAGTSEGAGNAWATIQKSADTVIAGDTVWVKATGTYVENVTATTAGTAGTAIWWKGYSSTTGDQGKVTIDPSSAGNAVSCTGNYNFWENFIFTGASSNGYSSSTGDSQAFYNCEFTSNGAAGCQGDNNAGFFFCEFRDNTTAGCDWDANCVFVGCIFSGNADATSTGMVGITMYKSLFYNNTDAITGTATTVIGCTFDGDGASTDLVAGVAAPLIYCDNIFYDTSATALDYSAASFNTGKHYLGNNLMNTVTTSYGADLEGYGVLEGYNDVTGAPAFTDEAGDDYTLGASSAAIDAGVQPGGVT